MDPQNFCEEFKNKYGRRYSKFLRFRQKILFSLIGVFALMFLIAGVMSVPSLEAIIRSNFVLGIILSISVALLVVLFFLHVFSFLIQVLAQDAFGYQKSRAINYHMAEAYLVDDLQEKWEELLKIDKILRLSPDTELADIEEKVIRNYVDSVKKVDEEDRDQVIEETIEDFISQYIYEKSIFRTDKLGKVVESARIFNGPTRVEKTLSKIDSKKLRWLVKLIVNYPQRSTRIISTVLLVAYIFSISQNFYGVGIVDGIIGAMYVQILWSPEKAINELVALRGFFGKIFDEIVPS